MDRFISLTSVFTTAKGYRHVLRSLTPDNWAKYKELESNSRDSLLNFFSSFKWIIVTRIVDKRPFVAKYYRFGVHSANISNHLLDNGGVEYANSENTKVWQMKIA